MVLCEKNIAKICPSGRQRTACIPQGKVMPASIFNTLPRYLQESRIKALLVQAFCWRTSGAPFGILVLE